MLTLQIQLYSRILIFYSGSIRIFVLGILDYIYNIHIYKYIVKYSRVGRHKRKYTL